MRTLVFAVVVLMFARWAHAEATTNPVISIRGADTPALKALSTRIYALAEEVYPEILKLTEHRNDSSPRSFSLEFKKGYGTEKIGTVKGKKILLNSEWLTEYPVDLDVVFVHEMAHFAQKYPRGAPLYWNEGMADYARFKVGFTNELFRCECSLGRSDYTAGWACAGAFLLWLEREYGGKVVRHLDVALADGKYDERVFEWATGKNVKRLWEEFAAKSGMVLPIAKSVAEVANAIGNASDLERKVSRAESLFFFQRMHGTNAAADLSWNDFQERMGVDFGKRVTLRTFAERYAAYVYLASPAGRLWNEAGRFLADEAKKGNVPGWRQDIWFPDAPTGTPEEYPFTHTFRSRAVKRSEFLIYEVTKPSAEAPWKLNRAWLAGPRGETLKELEAR
ncbi:MAG TPA: basic secretory protein-like protein [Verrucomicrobiae bacterium]|nr:basic secretory protein-like protein [Verrucomicrobiae bacterium]